MIPGWNWIKLVYCGSFSIQKYWKRCLLQKSQNEDVFRVAVLKWRKLKALVTVSFGSQIMSIIQPTIKNTWRSADKNWRSHFGDLLSFIFSHKTYFILKISPIDLIIVSKNLFSEVRLRGFRGVASRHLMSYARIYFFLISLRCFFFI